jgi:hypothetical protein
MHLINLEGRGGGLLDGLRPWNSYIFSISPSTLAVWDLHSSPCLWQVDKPLLLHMHAHNMLHLEFSRNIATRV